MQRYEQIFLWRLKCFPSSNLRLALVFWSSFQINFFLLLLQIKLNVLKWYTGQFSQVYYYTSRYTCRCSCMFCTDFIVILLYILRYISSKAFKLNSWDFNQWCHCTIHFECFVFFFTFCCFSFSWFNRRTCLKNPLKCLLLIKRT